MFKETDIAWLAGTVDGEGSLVLFKDKRANRGINCHVTMNMTDFATIDRVGMIFREISGDRVPVREKRPLSGFSKRLQFVVDVSSKNGCLRTLKALLPYLVTKRLQAMLCIEILTRAVGVRKYQCSELDYAMMATVKALKHHDEGGETRTLALALLGQVTPSQAVYGALSEGRQTEGVETRGVSSNNNPLHERPAPTGTAGDEDIVQSPSESSGPGLNSPAGTVH